MSDVVEGGPRQPWPRWVWLVVTATALLGLASYLLVRGDDSNRAGDGVGNGAATRSATPEPAIDTPSPSLSPWPTTRGACGGDVARPLFTATALRQRTSERVLVGGAQLSRVDVDTGRTTVLARMSHRGDDVFAIASAGSDVYALIGTCMGNDTPTLIHVDAGDRVRPVRSSGPVDGLFTGPDAVWGVDYPADAARSVVLRPLAGTTDRSTRRLPPGTVPVAATRSWIVSVRYSGPDGSISTVTRTPLAGSRTSALGRGWPLAVGTETVVWVDADCAQPAKPCRLHRSGPSGRVEQTYPMPADRGMGDGTIDPTGRQLAFRLTRAAPDPRYSPGHPGPPGDIAVLDLGSSRLRIVPRLELAPKTEAGLAFSADGRWLLISVAEGSHGDLLLWRIGSEVLQRTPTTLAGPLNWSPPLLRATSNRP